MFKFIKEQSHRKCYEEHGGVEVLVVYEKN